MDAVYRIGPGLTDLMTRDTIVCRCEERTVEQLETAIRDGAHTLDHLKAWTRGGMGPCSARMCGLPSAHLLARQLGVSVASLGWYRARPPVKPVSIEALVAEV